MYEEYISREAAMTVLDWDRASQDALNAIKALPAADVVAVVRCRECVFGNMPCATARYPDYFCADGKRKDGGQDDD